MSYATCTSVEIKEQSERKEINMEKKENQGVIDTSLIISLQEVEMLLNKKFDDLKCLNYKVETNL